MTPSGISERQNEEQNLRLLAAQRQLYTEEKRWTYLWYAGATIIALLATGALSAFDRYATLITLFAVIVTLGEILLLHSIRQRRVVAAGIQELFDGEVLKLPWNRALVRRPDLHEIDQAVARFKRRKNREEEWNKLKNWYGYDPLVKTAPLHQARLECQQENLYWDAGLRRFWRGLLLGSLVLVSLVLAAIGVRANWSVAQYFSGPMLLMIPIAFGVLSTVVGHQRAMERLDFLSGVLDDLRDDAQKAGTKDTVEEISARTRELQTEIYHHRCDDSPVPDQVYNWLRKRFESSSGTTS